MSELVFAGPYVGEFGWELFCWQGYLRQLAVDGSRVIAAARPGHEALYEDFAEEFVPVVPPEGYMPNGNAMDGLTLERYSNLVPSEARWINPMNVNVDWSKDCPWIEPQKFIPFGDKEAPKNYKILIHARDRKWELTSLRNWPEENWDKLVSSFPDSWTIGCIGTKEEALSCGSVDLRSLPLKELLQEISRAELVIGPSSGPIHLASLCRIPHVVWSGKDRDVSRYASLWNPFGVRHRMITTWQPNVSAVLSEVRKFFPDL